MSHFPQNSFQNIFHLLWMGNLPCSAMEVYWQPEPIGKPAFLQHSEKAFWNELVKKHPTANLFNGGLAELSSFRFENDRLFLKLRPSDYRAFMYSNFHRDDIIKNYGERFVNQGLGISAVVCTSDDKIVLMKRSEQVGEYPGKLDVFGGHIEPDRHIVKGVPDPCQGIRDELQEELGLLPKDIRNLRIIGLIRNAQTTKPELVFIAETAVGLKYLCEKSRSAVDGGEYDSLIDLPDETQSLKSFLEENAPEFSPSGFGSLWMYANQ